MWLGLIVGVKIEHEVGGALRGAFLFLLGAATSFSLVLRGLGTDQLVSDLMLAFQGHPLAATLATRLMVAGAV